MLSLQHINNEIQSKLKGIVKVDLASLSFNPPNGLQDIDELDKENVERLVKIFELEGCNRLSPAHSIPGSIPVDVLQTALQHSNLTVENLRSVEPPTLRLPPGMQIECLQGKHRLAALKESRKLHPWWTVRLYIDLSTDAKRLLMEDSHNEGRRSEGFIFLNILKNPLTSPNAKRWLGRLGTKSKVDIAKRLCKRDSLSGALRSVLEMPGQRKYFKLGVWKRIITEACDEEIVHYLRLIYDTFALILGSEAALGFVDEETVQNLELRAPGVSYQDDLHVSTAVSQNAVLWHLEDESSREQALGRLRSIKYLIPTIYTLQMDFYYLRPCTSVMRRLISGKDRLPVTVQVLAWNAFAPPNDSVFTPELEFLGKLKLLYLHIMQNVVELSGENPLLDDEPKQEPLQHDENAWVQLAIEAKRKGFHSNEISRLCSIDLERKVASNMLLAARPPSRFDWGGNFDKLVDMQAQILKEARPIQNELGRAELTTRHHAEPIARRCGRQYSKAYTQDRHFYTEDWFTCQVHKGPDITSLFVRRSVFLAFWGLHDHIEREIPSENDNDMPDASEGAEISGEVDQSMDPSAPNDVGDHEMRDAPAFSRRLKRKQPGQTLAKKKAQRDRNREVPVGETPSEGVALQSPARRGTTPGEVIAADRGSAVTTFIPPPTQLELRTDPVGEQQVTGLDRRQMTIMIRKGGVWGDARRCRRASIIQGIEEVRRENQGQKLNLYTGEGRGIRAKDCPNLPDDFVCLSTDATGFPVEEIL